MEVCIIDSFDCPQCEEAFKNEEVYTIDLMQELYGEESCVE